MDAFRGLEGNPFADVEQVEDLPFGTPNEEITARVDATDRYEQKVAAMRAHATQITTDGPFFALSNNVGSQAWGVEFYRIAKGERGELGPDGLEADLFAGI